ncbi:clustered mitochondria protein-like protein [Tanacetum coccineum]
MMDSMKLLLSYMLKARAQQMCTGFQGTMKGYLKEALRIESNMIGVSAAVPFAFSLFFFLLIEESKGPTQYAKDQIYYQKADLIIEKFTQDASEKIIEIMEGKPDLIIGNYTDGNLAAWQLFHSSRKMLECKAFAHPFKNIQSLFPPNSWLGLHPVPGQLRSFVTGEALFYQKVALKTLILANFKDDAIPTEIGSTVVDVQKVADEDHVMDEAQEDVDVVVVEEGSQVKDGKKRW